MRAVVMIIRRVRGKKPLQMARVQSDNVVEQIAAAANPANSESNCIIRQGPGCRLASWSCIG